MTPLNFTLSRTAGRDLSPSDEILVTRFNHDANVASWLELARDKDLATATGVHPNPTPGQITTRAHQVRTSGRRVWTDPREDAIQRLGLGPWHAPREYESVSRVARDDVDMEVEDILPAGQSIRLEQREARRIETFAKHPSDPMHGDCDPAHLLRRDVPDVRGVSLRDHKGVPIGDL